VLVGLLGGMVVVATAVGLWRIVRRSHDRSTVASIALTAQVQRRRKRLAEPVLRLVPGGDQFTKLGGVPDLPPDTSPPMGATGPLAFLAQVDLASARAAGGPEWLPSEGRIYFFYAPFRHGFADVVQVVYSLGDSGGIAPASTLAPPYRERRADLSPAMSCPSFEWLGVDVADLARVADEICEDEDGRPTHKIGGYPDELQDEQMSLSCELIARGLDPDGVHETSPAIERATRDWRLLLQMDSDPDLKMSFGDGGRLYIFVKRSDARNGVFSRTVAIWQST